MRSLARLRMLAAFAVALGQHAMRSLARLRMLAAFAVALGHAPKEVEDLMNAPRVPHTPADPPEKKTVRNAEDLEVELPTKALQLTRDPGKPPPVMLRTDHAMQGVLKAKFPNLNRKQRRQLAHRMQARATKARQS